MDDESMEQESIDTANSIGRACHGKSNEVVYRALCMVIGKFAAQDSPSDFEGLMQDITNGAFQVFESVIDQSNGPH